MSDVKSKVSPMSKNSSAGRERPFAAVRAKPTCFLSTGSFSVSSCSANSLNLPQNLYELLGNPTNRACLFESPSDFVVGNTSDQDSDREPSPPPKTAEKPNPRAGKRDAPKDAPAEPAHSGGRGGRGGARRGGFTGSEDGTFMNGSIASPLREGMMPDFASICTGVELIHYSFP